MTYYYHDASDGYKQNEYDGDPLFVIRETAGGTEARLVYVSADSAKQHLFAMLENPPANLSLITYGIETPDGQQLYIKV